MKVKFLLVVFIIGIVIMPLSAQMDQTNPPRHISFRSQSNEVDVNARLIPNLHGSRMFNYDIVLNSSLGVIYFRMPGTSVNIATFSYRLQCYVDRIGPGFNNNQVQLTDLFRTVSLSDQDMDRWYSQTLVDNRSAALYDRVEVDDAPDDPYANRDVIEVDDAPDDPYANRDVIEVDDAPDDPYANRDVIEVDDAPDRIVYGFEKPLYIELDGFILIIDDVYFCDTAEGSGKELHLQAALAKVDPRAEKIVMNTDEAFTLIANGRDRLNRLVDLKLKAAAFTWDSFIADDPMNADLSWAKIVDKDVIYSNNYRANSDVIPCRIVFQSSSEVELVQQLESLYLNVGKRGSEYKLEGINVHHETRGMYKRAYPFVFNAADFQFTLNSIQRVAEKPHLIRVSVSLENKTAGRVGFYLKNTPITMIADINDGKTLFSDKIPATIEWEDGSRAYRERQFQAGEQHNAYFFFEAPKRWPIENMLELVIEQKNRTFDLDLTSFILR